MNIKTNTIFIQYVPLTTPHELPTKTNFFPVTFIHPIKSWEVPNKEPYAG